MSHGPSLAEFVPPPAPAADEPPAPPEPPVLGGAPATLPLPATPGAPPLPPGPVALWTSSMVPDVGYSVLFGVRVTLLPEAQYEYGASAIATASVRLLPSVL